MTLRRPPWALALAVVLAGCGGSGTRGAATTGGPTRGATGGAIYGDIGSSDASGSFAACMRGHGVTLGARGPGRVSPTSPRFRRAAAACRSAGKLPGTAGSAGG
jgi:hypothetical protein